MKLSQLIKSIDSVNGLEIEDIDIKGISYHSQKTSNDSLFVCVRGYKVDGHNYLHDAVKKGAKAAVVEEFQENISIPQFLVKDSRVALGQLGNVFYQCPSEKMKMIGITATNGKTTTSYMMNAILENEGLKTGLIGTVVIKTDDVSIESELTTPESLDLHYYLNEMVKKGVSHVCMEVSSASLQMQRVDAVNYDIVALNNLTPEHAETHGSFEKYVEVKSRLIREADEKSIAVLNLDSTYSASLVNQTKAKVISYGIDHKNGYIHCKNVDLSTGRAIFTVEILKPIPVGDNEVEPSKFTVELGVPGMHSVYNAMAAITIGLLCGVSISTIQHTLKEFSGVPRRFEFIYEDEFIIIDDHFANPGNIEVTLQTLEHMDYENLQLVYAIRGQRGPTINKDNAEAIAESASKLNIREIIATKSSSHVTSKDEVTDEEMEAFMDVMQNANIRVDVYDELPDAIHAALSVAKKKDLVLLAGCQGMDYGAGIALDHVYKDDVKIEGKG
ncbi:Mur ligase family protein [Virgibacillus necropolis]|uniref:UDP-N-acetylmuramyl peptide synthase n=1 Tax=Virgibacillus necropolis TaxID=163877 RepID=A0A221M8H7_9BACI|nr:UDP-N-acetylmuramyl-tripeptide synthetase [Virgibacillus necropolis]ASN03948.1 UDP-N-acetylmuramyl peptide synthase [Virgibacillus necropolis]